MVGPLIRDTPIPSQSPRRQNQSGGAWPVGSGSWDAILEVSGSNVGVTGTALADITGLVTGTLTASAQYEFEAVLLLNSSVIGGLNVGFNSTGTSPTGWCNVMGPTGAPTTGGIVGVAGNNTASATFLASTGATGAVVMKGIVQVGTGSPTLAIRMQSVTSGATSTAAIGSSFKYRKL